MKTQPARVIAIVIAGLTALVGAIQANQEWTNEQVALIIAALSAIGAVATALWTQRAGVRLMPLVVTAGQSIVAVGLAFGLDIGSGTIAILGAVLAGVGGEVNRGHRSPMEVSSG